MERKIETPLMDSFSSWPKPYSWMLEDLTNAANVNANYLVALGLLCYTEYLGRQILEHRNGKEYKPTNKECFDIFFIEYMGYGDIIQKHPGLYGWFRDGMVHDYAIKQAQDRGSGVYHYVVEEDKEAFRNMGVDPTKGTLIRADGLKRIFVIEDYLRDFKNGIERFLKEKREIS